MNAKIYEKPNGASAQSIWVHLCGGDMPQNGDYPRDDGDFGRCEAFLMQHPELRARLGEMAEVNAYWAALAPRWDEIRDKSDPAGRYTLIRDIVEPVLLTDPSHIGIGDGASVRFGPITFKGAPEAAKPEAKAETLDDLLDDLAGQNSADPQGEMVLQLKEGPTRLPWNREVMAAQISAGLAGRKMTRAEVDAILAKQQKAEGADVLSAGWLDDADRHNSTAGSSQPAQKKTPFKDDKDFRKHNQGAYNVAADELRQFIERVEQLDAEKRDIAEQQKEVMAEAKGRGYDTKVIRKVIALRKRKADEIAEEEAILDMYKSALGMG
jgi:uncharacterized protein (UPF0335 family)